MGIYSTVIIFDDHLGMLNGRTAEQEAEFINYKLSEMPDEVVSIPFKHFENSGCIIGEIKYLPGEEHLSVFNYDYVYYKPDYGGPLVRFLKEDYE
jgi:hypothetical protein